MPATLHRLVFRTRIARPPAALFPFFSDPANLEALTPPSLRFQVLGRPGPAHEGQVIDYRLRVHGLPVRWRTLITHWDPPRGFVDVAVFGPYRFWHHSHRFSADGRGTLMTDTIHYSLPGGTLGDALAGAFVRRDIESIFRHRAEAVARLFSGPGMDGKTRHKRGQFPEGRGRGGR